MDTTAVGQPLLEGGQPTKANFHTLSYTDSLKPQSGHIKKVPLKSVTYLHGETIVLWEQEEVDKMIINENLECAVIGKFSYGWPNIQDLRKLIPKQWIQRTKGSKLSTSGRSVEQVDASSKLEESPNIEIQKSHNVKDRGSNIQALGKSSEHVEVSSRMEENSNNEKSTNVYESRKQSETKESEENVKETPDDQLPQPHAKEALDLMEDFEELIQHRRETEEDESMEYNIQQISKAGDLSPRHTNSLKAKRGRPTIPLQVKTRSIKDRGTHSDQ
uniref:Uncharacterized protein n=1 Tax=Solanum tuberosum TaxID=4113 RepID=M1DSS2_SOLTU